MCTLTCSDHGCANCPDKGFKALDGLVVAKRDVKQP